ncbi:mechanosensitive ion channel protein 10-like isoform X3 [Macadamia integrifolia]|uniref:mechanosensitive ion channel protein 10-like isoform X1 n=1 Tax=Macadamia integrifolia TaxID=60698 RepID=UPI001C4E70C1|nr:mechanosensitive ion channel protein 10-like isoform X1 [Macadamia integrifolia]XP_042486448.1 mechanosensitive ion channel protein 10-like isoform X2 [Macadamia integrifolia]XP_042486449.1 mechanosensitive ion channel protein 10-like isoform X3 [Macadamia integrifolia]
MQNLEKEKPTTDQVVLHLEQPNPKPKLYFETEQLTNNKDDKSPNPTRTHTLRRLNFSKPKSRFVEINYPPPSKPIPESDSQEHFLPNGNDLLSTDDDSDDDDLLNEDEEDEENNKGKYRKKRKIGKRLIIEWVLFVIILTSLICSLTMKSLKYKVKWGLVIWKWCLMVMVIFSGRLVSAWFVGLLVFLIERNFLLREKVLYFVYGLRKSVQNCVWLGLVLLAWTFMFNPEVEKDKKILKMVFKSLVAVLIGATIWLVKIVLVKMLASSFHVTTFFDRMKESVFNHYILESLSGSPMDEEEIEEEAKKGRFRKSKSLPARLREGGKRAIMVGTRSKRYGSRRIDMEKLRRLTSTASAFNVKRLVNYVRSSGLSTISRTVDDFANAESEITSEWEARTCAQRIFKNVAKPGAKYIEEEDLMRFLRREEVHTIFPLFEGALEIGQIRKSSFRNWVVRAYIERKSLAHSLNDTKTAVQQLHKLASAIVSVIIIVVSLLVMGLATTKVILVVTSQLLLVGFMFQNTCKTIFESIIFVFVMHPFDVGDRCVIEGVQMIVEEMNILTTVFLRYDNEKIYYPNSVLLTKPISNFYRSPEMADTIDFTIDISTSIETVTALKKAIYAYIESKPKYWNPKHSVIVKEIENINKMKMCLCVLHTMNHQNYGERNNRRTELILELKKIFENLGIKYHLLPQEVHLTQFHMANERMPMHS